MTDLTTLKTELVEASNKKEEVFAAKQAVSSSIVAAIGKIKEHKTKRDELTGQVKELKVKRDELNSQLKVLFAQLREHAPPQQPQSQSGEKRVSVSLLKKQIADMQYKIETSGMTFEDEKKMMKRIKDLQKQVGEASVFVTHKSEYKEVSNKIDSVKADSDKLHEEIQQKAAASQKEHEAILVLSTQIDTLRVEEKKLTSQATELKASLKEHQSKVSAMQTVSQASSKAQAHVAAQKHKEVIEKKVADVEEKIKKKKKLTTEDLLIFQSEK